MTSDTDVFSDQLAALIAKSKRHFDEIDAAGIALVHESRLIEQLRQQVIINNGHRFELLSLLAEPQPTPRTEAERAALRTEIDRFVRPQLANARQPEAKLV